MSDYATVAEANPLISSAAATLRWLCSSPRSSAEKRKTRRIMTVQAAS